MPARACCGCAGPEPTITSGSGVVAVDMSIGSTLADGANRAVDRALLRAGASSGVPLADRSSFGAQLEASFRARAERLGLHLPAPDSATTGTPGSGAVAPTADDAWRRAQALSVAAGNGPGDAMLQALDDRSAAKALRGTHPRGGFDDLFG